MMRLFSKLVIVASLLISSGLAINSYGEGTLNVKTDPEGIEVWIDDNFIGDSPILEKKLKPGRYTLKLIDPVQHSSTVEEIFIQEGESTIIEKTIKSKFGSLRINTDPEGAQVFISSELGKTPLANDFMNPGKYRVELKYPDNKKLAPIVEDIVIPRGETVNLTKAFKKEKLIDKNAKIRLALGAATAAFFIFGIVEQGTFKENKRSSEYQKEQQLLKAAAESTKKADKARIGSIIGVIGGSICLIGLEITTFL